MPAVQAVWVSSDGNWNTPGSWSTAAVPLDTDEVVFDGSSQVNVSNGLDQTTIYLTSLVRLPGYRGRIGTSGGPLRIAAHDVVLLGNGETYIKGESTGADVINNLVLDGQRGYAQIDGDVIRVYVKRGEMLVAEGTDDITLMALTSVQSVATINYAAGNTIATLIVERGTCLNRREVTTRMVIGDGIVTQSGHGTIAELSQYGGRFTYTPDFYPLANPAITNLNLFGGWSDFSSAHGIIYVTNMIRGPNATVTEGSFGIAKNSYWQDLTLTIPLAGP